MKRVFVAVLLLGACGSQQVKVAPLKIEPIHITVDVNLHDKGDKADKADANNADKK
jgi:hypothetical protein